MKTKTIFLILFISITSIAYIDASGRNKKYDMILNDQIIRNLEVKNSPKSGVVFNLDLDSIVEFNAADNYRMWRTVPTYRWGKLSKEVRSNWRETFWNEIEMDQYDFDEDNNLLSLRSSEMTNALKWRYTDKVDNTFENGKIIGSKYYEWNIDWLSWELTMTNIYTYPSWDKQEIVMSAFNDETQEWEEQIKQVLTFNSAGKQTLLEMYIMDMLYSKSIYTYNNAGNLITVEMFNANLMTGVLIQSKKTENGYNANNDLISCIVYNWINGKWQESTKNTYSFDLTGNPSRDEVYAWDNVKKGWICQTYLIYYYKTSGITNSQKDDIVKIWVKDKSIVIENINEGDQISIFTLSGTMIYNTPANNNIMEIPVEPGAYIVKTTQNTTKVMVML